MKSNAYCKKHQFVSNNCPINVYGQAWTACRFLDWTACAVRVALPPLAPPCGWRSPNDLDVAANAAASAGSYGQRIEGKRCANRYPTLEMPTQYIFGAFLTAKTRWFLTSGGSESLGKSRLPTSIPELHLMADG